MEETRLKIVRDELGGMSQAKLANYLGLPAHKIRDIESGKVKMSLDIAKAVEEKFGFSSLWMVSGVGPKRINTQVEEGLASYGQVFDGYIQVPRYEVAASAGGGSLVQSEQIVDHLTFKKDWLHQQLGLSPNQVAVISVMGDSMEPYLFDGDLIMIDTNIPRIENNAVYVLQVDGDLLVKRIQKKIDGTVIVKSDNEHYEPEVFRGEALSQLRVVGRLVRRLVR